MGRQMKTGLLHGMQQAFSQHLEVKSQIAIQLWRQLLLLLQKQLNLALSFLAHRDQAACMAATSAAKSIFCTSMPSPRVKRTKRRT